MSIWTLRLLGEMTIESAHQARPLRLARKGKALLLHVGSHGRAGVPRGRLLALLWDDHGPDDARNALRQCLHHVRVELGEAAAILVSEGDRILISEASCSVDTLRFEALARSTKTSDLSAAVDWYRGDLADGLEAGAEFGLWAVAERERLRDLAHGVVARLGERDLCDVAIDDAIRLARRLLAADRGHEGTCRALMRLYARAGLRSKALQAWADCRRALRDDLGVAPSAPTAALAAELSGEAAASQPGVHSTEPATWWLAASTPPGSTLLSIGDPRVLDLMLRGWQLFTTYTVQGHAKAREVYQQVIDLVPHHADALALLGWTHWFDSISGWSADPAASFRQASQAAERALACGGGNAPPHGLMGKVLLWQMRHAEAVVHLQQAVALAPGYSYMHFHLGEAAMWTGHPDESIMHVDRALRLEPNDHGVFLTVRGMAQWMSGNPSAARASLESAVRRNPSYPWAHGMLAVVHHEAGEFDGARRAAREARRFNRRFSVHFAARVLPFLVPQHRERMAEAWQHAGLPAEEMR